MQELSFIEALHRVADGVPEVQDAAQAVFLGILLHDVPFDAQRAAYYLRQIRVKILAFFDDLKKLRRACRGHFYRLGKTGHELPPLEGLQRSGVYYHFFRLVKRTDYVLDAPEIDGGLPSDGGIDLSEQGSRDVVEINAAHIAGGREAAQIAHHAAADGDNAVAPCKRGLEHGRKQALELLKALAALAAGHGHHDRLFTLTGHASGVLRRNALVRYDENAAVKLKELSGFFQAAALKHDIVAAVVRVDGNYHLFHSSVLRFE